MTTQYLYIVYATGAKDNVLKAHVGDTINQCFEDAKDDWCNNVRNKIDYVCELAEDGYYIDEEEKKVWGYYMPSKEKEIWVENITWNNNEALAGQYSCGETEVNIIVKRFPSK
jgi:hypothetical protein